MKLQKNTSLALYSVLEFARDPARHVPAAEIAEKYGVSQTTPVEAGLSLVLSEIDENARATFRSITLATMLRLIERQQAAMRAG